MARACRSLEPTDEEEAWLVNLHAAARLPEPCCLPKRSVKLAFGAVCLLAATGAALVASRQGAPVPAKAPQDVAGDVQRKAAAWLAEHDAATGKTYYYSPQLRKTVWNLPPAAVLAPSTTPMPTEPTAVAACPGSLAVPGLGEISLVSARWNTAGNPAGQMEVNGDRVTAHMGSRSYWAGSCGVGNPFNPNHYAGVQLLGKTMKWTVSLTGLECGCNVAFYLTSMRQNVKPSSCQDYYCDAGNVCGVSCDEVDLMEANQYAWFSTLHMNGDKNGAHVGYGHFVYDWNSTTYGPGAACIDTNKPIEVAVSFPTGPMGGLTAMTVTLSQVGTTCPLTATISDYGTGMARISAAMARGMTPVLSYWSSPDMMWMDGIGVDGRGPCQQDTPAQCASSVEIHGFSVEPLLLG